MLIRKGINRISNLKLIIVCYLKLCSIKKKQRSFVDKKEVHFRINHKLERENREKNHNEKRLHHFLIMSSFVSGTLLLNRTTVQAAQAYDKRGPFLTICCLAINMR